MGSLISSRARLPNIPTTEPQMTVTRGSRVVQTPKSLGEELQSPTINHVEQTAKETKRAFRIRENWGKEVRWRQACIYYRETEKGLRREHGKPGPSEYLSFPN